MPDTALAIPDAPGRRHHEITLRLGDCEQLLCWVPPGRARLGSEPDEHGASADEWPAHEVCISRGFWLFATPVTQQLWQALCGDNPSAFVSPHRPVESIDMGRVQDFLARAGALLPGLCLELPSEAEWEYAARAGSSGPTWLGECPYRIANDAPLLDRLAWYAGNAASTWHAEHGVDARHWADCDHRGARAGSHPVMLREPNPWGLYDMLGNVWEWCRDGMRDYASAAAIDPIGPLHSGLHCVRGGSWRDGAQKIRAAYRDQVEADYANNFVGFRCLSRSLPPPP